MVVTVLVAVPGGNKPSPSRTRRCPWNTRASPHLAPGLLRELLYFILPAFEADVSSKALSDCAAEYVLASFSRVVKATAPLGATGYTGSLHDLRPPFDMASSEMPMHPPYPRSHAAPRLGTALKQYIRPSQRDLKRSSRPPSTNLAPSALSTPPAPMNPSTNGDRKLSWLRWAGQKVADKVADKVAGSEAALGVRTERVRLFPGWASRRYHVEKDSDLETYDIDIYVSGVAVKEREFGVLTRSQKAVVKLAKSFASLPKVDGKLKPEDPVMSRSTEDLIASMGLPPRPDEIDVESETRLLQDYKQRAGNGSSSSLPSSTSDSLPSPTFSSRSSPYASDPSTPRATQQPFPQRPPLSPRDDSTLKRLHRNLERRLQPFWASALPSREVRVAVYALEDEERERRTSEELQLLDAPIAMCTVLTDAEGAFSARFTVSWQDLCAHPRGIHIAFSPSAREDELQIAAELLPAPTSGSAPTLEKIRGAIAAHMPSPRSEQSIPLSHCQVRVISDIDDTVKLSNILHGARSVFYNVFVKDLQENVIHGMGDWYREMWTRGVRFHYISNGPFELLPVIQEFLALAQLPPGSIRLRLYSTRTIFSGLLSAPAARKRAGVEEVLTSFPASRFILVGDSGEQDLELYAEQAQLRPGQIIAVFVRDANTYEDGGSGISDPTGARAIARALSMPEPPFAPTGIRSTGRSRRDSTASIVSSLKSEDRARSAPPSPGASPVQRFKNLSMAPREPPASAGVLRQSQMTPKPMTPRSSVDSGGYFAPSAPAVNAVASEREPLYTEPGSYAGSDASSQSQTPVLSDSDKKRQVLQARVWAARLQMPGNVVLRVFRYPEECVEATQLLDGLLLKPRS